MKQKGQALVLVAVILPILLLAVGALIRSGQTAFYNYRVQKFIDYKALDILQVQAKGLSRLGDINPYAKSVIDTRRYFERVLKVCKFYCAPLVAAIIKLRITQSVISAQQMAIKATTWLQVQQKMRASLPPDLSGKVHLNYSKASHLYVTKQSNYSSETGAPLTLERDFSNKQKIEITAQMQTEKLLDPMGNKRLDWHKSTEVKFDKLKNMKLGTLAKVEMSDLEKEWTIQIRKNN